MKFFKNNSGFTLMEMVVALTIVALMAGLMMANYRESEKENNLVMEAQQLAADIRTAQNNTMGAVKYGTSTPKGGWGIHIDTSNENSYKLFANINYDPDDDGDPDNLQYDDSPKDEALPKNGGKEVQLKENIKIASTTMGSRVDISFVPPDPDTILYNPDSNSTSSNVDIILENKSKTTRKVKINSFGLVEIVQ